MYKLSVALRFIFLFFFFFFSSFFIYFFFFKKIKTWDDLKSLLSLSLSRDYESL